MYTIVKISLIVTLALLVSTVARISGILDDGYISIIMDVLLIIQAVILSLLVAILIIKRQKMNGVKIVRYKFDNKFIKGNTDIIPECVSPTSPRKPALFKVFLEIDIENIKNMEEPPEFGIFKIGTGKAPQDIKNHIINANSGIIENSFIFDADIIVSPGEKINFRIKKDTIIKSFFLGEIYIP